MMNEEMRVDDVILVLWVPSVLFHQYERHDQRVQGLHDRWLDFEVWLSGHSEQKKVPPTLVVDGYWFSVRIILFDEFRQSLFHSPDVVLSILPSETRISSQIRRAPVFCPKLACRSKLLPSQPYSRRRGCRALPLDVVLQLRDDFELLTLWVHLAHTRRRRLPFRRNDLVVDHVVRVRDDHVLETGRGQRQALRLSTMTHGQRNGELVGRKGKSVSR